MIEVPPPVVVAKVWPQLLEFFRRLGSVDWPEGLGITSWYRGSDKNLAVGGAPDSQHQLGLAFDLVLPEWNRDSTVIHIRQSGLVVVDEFDHLHVQAFPAGYARSMGFFDA